MKLHLWLYRLENKISKIAIEKLMSLLTVAMAIVWVMDILISLSGYEISIYGLLYFDRGLIFSGQVWRIITFLFLQVSCDHNFYLLCFYQDSAVDHIHYRKGHIECPFCGNVS